MPNKYNVPAKREAFEQKIYSSFPAPSEIKILSADMAAPLPFEIKKPALSMHKPAIPNILLLTFLNYSNISIFPCQ